MDAKDKSKPLVRASPRLERWLTQYDKSIEFGFFFFSFFFSLKVWNHLKKMTRTEKCKICMNMLVLIFHHPFWSDHSIITANFESPYIPFYFPLRRNILREMFPPLFAAAAMKVIGLPFWMVFSYMYLFISPNHVCCLSCLTGTLRAHLSLSLFAHLSRYPMEIFSLFPSFHGAKHGFVCFPKHHSSVPNSGFKMWF